MTTITTEMIGFDKAFRKLALSTTYVQKRVKPEILLSASKALNYARGFVPRRTGELASTLRMRVSKDGMVGFVDAGYGVLKRANKSRQRRKHLSGAKLYTLSHMPGVYAPVVEFGSRRNHASPFLRPAIEAVRNDHNERIFVAIKNGLEDLAKTENPSDSE